MQGPVGWTAVGWSGSTKKIGCKSAVDVNSLILSHFLVIFLSLGTESESETIEAMQQKLKSELSVKKRNENVVLSETSEAKEKKKKEKDCCLIL